MEQLPNKTKHKSVQDSSGSLLNEKCSQRFQTENERIKLKREKRGIQRLCIYCRKKVKYIYSHMRHMHKNIFIKCTYTNCVNYFKSEAERIEHTKTFHDKNMTNMRRCSICLKKILYTSMNRHMNIFHSSQKAIMCKFILCHTNFRSAKELKQHETQIHKVEEREQCIYCNLSYPTRVALRAHTLQKHQSEAIRCSKCDTFFHSEAERVEHYQLVYHETTLMRKTCIYCSIVCIDRHRLSEHVKRKHSDVQIRCKYLMRGRFFFSQVEQEQHFEQKHRQEEENKKFQCQKCSLKFKRISKPHYHNLAAHEKAPLQQCPKCPKVLKNLFRLKMHCQRMHRERIIVCER